MARYRVLRSFVGRRENGLPFKFSRGQVVELEDARDWVRAGLIEALVETPRGDEDEAIVEQAASLPIEDAREKPKAERAVGKRKRLKN